MTEKQEKQPKISHENVTTGKFDGLSSSRLLVSVEPRKSVLAFLN